MAESLGIWDNFGLGITSQYYLSVISSALAKTHPFLDDQQFIDYYSTGFPDWSWHDFYYNLAWMGLSETEAWKVYKSNVSSFESYKEYLRKFITNSNNDVP